MKAAVMTGFNEPFSIQDIPRPDFDAEGALIKVSACGVCRTDHHIWHGLYDVDIPMVLGHELSGVVEQVGSRVTRFKSGDRVVVTMCGGCGDCDWCIEGRHHSCDAPYQPGFNASGGFGEYVAVHQANINMVKLPHNIDDFSAAAMGCRYITAFHGIVEVGKLKPGEWVSIHGCGGVGLSAVQIANAAGGLVIAIDIDDDKLKFCKELGATHTINSSREDPVEAIRHITDGGAHLSMDALGIAVTCQNSINGLRKHGRHVQVGITSEQERGQISLPVDQMMSYEIEFLGSHGMPISSFSGLLKLVETGKLNPGLLVKEHAKLEDINRIMDNIASFNGVGVTVIDMSS